MGLILDSSVLIADERRGETVKRVIQRVHTTHGDQESALSAMSIIELTHGIYRAKTDTDRTRRRAFTEELASARHDRIRFRWQSPNWPDASKASRPAVSPSLLKT